VGIEAKMLHDTMAMADMDAVTAWNGYTADNSPVYHSAGAPTYSGFVLPYVSVEAAKNQSISFGPQTYNLYASGGFTFLAYMAFTSDPPSTREVLFRMQISPDLRLDIGRKEGSSRLAVRLLSAYSDIVMSEFESSNGNGNGNGVIVRDEWAFFGVMYVSFVKRLIIFKGSETPTEIDNVVIADAQVSSDTMAMGSPFLSSESYLSANIAGMYLYDRPLLGKGEISSVATQLFRSSIPQPPPDPTGVPSAAPTRAGITPLYVCRTARLSPLTALFLLFFSK
jgi:hypothetical protein